MSFKAFVWAWEQDVPSGDYHHVLLALANIAPTRKVRASVGYIAKQVRRSPRKVRSAIGWLAEAGLIVVESRKGKVDFIHLQIPASFIVQMDDEDDDDDREIGSRGRAKTPTKPLPNPYTPCAGEPLEPEEPSFVLVRAPDPFEEWWRTYPRKTAKDDARKAWAKVHKRLAEDALTLADLMDRTRVYADHVVGMGDQFVMHGSTYLNGKRWNDQLPDRSQTDGRGQPSAGANSALERRIATTLRPMAAGAQEAVNRRRQRWGFS